MSNHFFLGDEAVAMAALHAGISAAYGYPGTPSTEILETLIRMAPEFSVKASWSVNEKTALEQALGVSLVGRRSIVTMKHVGLNVAADAFINGSHVSIHGGLVIAVADDPGMHSSQNEQDSRYYADFAHTLCLEPANQQEAYEMTREAFELSEKFKIPVLLKLVTRLAHSRAAVKVASERRQNKLKKATNIQTEWSLLPGTARKQWHSLLERYREMEKFTDNCKWNQLSSSGSGDVGIITTGIARNYYLENLEDLSQKPWHLHLGAYPIAFNQIRELCNRVKKVLVFEEGYPYVERFMNGVFGAPIPVEGKYTGLVPREGELNPDFIRKALGLAVSSGMNAESIKMSFKVSGRPPQLCQGCPHGDSFKAIREALAEIGITNDSDSKLVTGDIGCYALGVLPPHQTLETCVCMGSSVGMAKGASDAGFRPVVGVIGDSTFLHSGMQPLLDAVAANTDMTLIIVDNEVVAMTGGQETIIPSSKLEGVVRGLGVDTAHLHTVEAHRKNHQANVTLLKQEIEYRGLSVIIAVRECVETAKRKKASS